MKVSYMTLILLLLCSITSINSSSINNKNINSISTKPINDNNEKTYSFDSNNDRVNRYNKLITSIKSNTNIIKLLVSLEERIAILIKEDILLMIQCLLSLWTLLNVLLENILAINYQQSIRLQSIVVIIITKVIDIMIRMNTIQSWEEDRDDSIKTKSGFKSINDDKNTTSIMIDKATNDISNIVNSKESQQIAFSLVMLICMAPRGSVYPLVIADIPNIIRLTIIIAYVIVPNEMKSLIANNIIFKETSSDYSVLDTTCDILALISELGLMLTTLNPSNMSFMNIVQAIVIAQYSITRISLFISRSGSTIDINNIITMSLDFFNNNNNNNKKKKTGNRKKKGGTIKKKKKVNSLKKEEDSL